MVPYSLIQVEGMIRPEEIDINEDDSLVGGKNDSVFKATFQGNRVVALKKLASDATFEALQQIGSLWQSLDHPNVLRVFGVSPYDADPLYVVTEFHQNMDVRRYLGTTPNADRPGIVLDTAIGMQYLHSRGLIHGSLKTSEILIKDDGHACIADAGMTEVQTSKNEESHRYFSPEAWKGTVSRPSDVFAFAMCALEIFTSSPPWGILAEKHIYRNVALEDTRPDRPEQALSTRVGLTDNIWELIEKSWKKEARLRPTFDDIVRDWNRRDVNLDHGHDQPGETERSSNLARHQSLFTVPPPAYEAHSSGSIHRSPSTPTMHVPPPFSESRGFHGHGGGQSTIIEEIRARELSALRPQESSSMRIPGSDESNTPPRALVPRRSNASGYSVSKGSSSSSSPLGPGMVYPTGTPGKDFESGKHSTTLQPFSAPPDVDSFSVPLGVRASQLPASAPASVQSFGQRSYSVRTGKLPDVEEESRYYTHTHLAPLRKASVYEDAQSTNDRSSTTGVTSVLLLVGALQAEVNEGRRASAINEHLYTIYRLASDSSKTAQKLVTAGVIPTLLLLLKIRAANADSGVEFVLMALGALAFDSITANTIYRTNTTTTLIQLYISSISDEISTLSVWCLSRICRSTDIANGLIKQGLTKDLIQRGLHGGREAARHAAWCLGNLVHSDAIAELLADMGVIPEIVKHLRTCTDIKPPSPEDISSGLFAIARMGRSIKLAKSLAKAGAVDLLAYHLSYSTDGQVLDWSARAIGCMMRPNSSDMSKLLLEAGVARGLARLPSVLPSSHVEPLASFAFAIQRFSCAEWGGGTRKALVDAGVVDALLAALRTAADEPYPRVHIELALAVSFLGDVGGSAIRKEIINAGGVRILKRVGENGSLEVRKACTLAATSVSGNLWSRNAASAKTALNHNWSGGCPEHQPPCPEFVRGEQRLSDGFSAQLRM